MIRAVKGLIALYACLIVGYVIRSHFAHSYLKKEKHKFD